MDAPTMDRRQFLRRAAPSAAVSAASRAPTAPPSAVLPHAGGLAPFVPTADAPWDARRARHVLRRAGAGAPPARVAALVAQSPAAAVGGLVDAALAAPMPPAPSWATLLPPPAGAPQAEVAAFNAANGAGLAEAAALVFDDLLEARAPGTALRERLALVWHGVVTTNVSQAGNRAFRHYAYWDVLRRNALGSYEALVREAGLTQQMLVYLNGAQNRVGAPNENYARELLELFTLGLAGPDGQPPYTQADIENLARALTGWTAPQTRTDALFVPSRHDAGQKTLFGQTGAFGYDTAHDVIFSERRSAIAHFVARHLYRAFVAHAPNEAVVAEMAARLVADGLAVAPTVRALLGSAHALQADALGARVKSPAELMLGLAAETGYSNLPGLYSSLRTAMRDLGFELFRPPDVSGWEGGRTWLDTSRLPLRWVSTDRFLGRRSELRALALTMPAPADPYALTADLAALFVALPLPADTLAEAVSVLLAGIPDYEWNPNVASAEGRLRGLVQFLMRLPDAQLL